MNALIRFPYDFLWRAADVAAHVAPDSDNKIIRAIRVRRQAVSQMRAWALSHRDARRKLLWLHAASVGESLQAVPVLQMLRERVPDVQIAFTHFSPSAEPFRKRMPADFIGYLPFDSSSSMRAAIEALQPTALVFSKLDVWPMLVREAARADIKTALVSGTVSSHSGRYSRIASLVLHDAYATLDSVGAISDDDRRALIELGARPARVTVTGDTRYDQVWGRRSSTDSAATIASMRSARPTIIAGSTWPSDQRVLFDAFTRARISHPQTRLVIAPHEPSARAVDSIERWAASQSFKSGRLDSTALHDADVIIVDRTGVLADLYAGCDIAFVGGGFHRAGLHSVLEPAAFGKPVLFGPMGNSLDAQLLVHAGAGRIVRSADQLARQISTWLTNADQRNHAGAAAESAVKKGLGAAEASYRLVVELLQ